MQLFSVNSNSALTEIHWLAYPIGLLLVTLCLFTVLGNFLIICAIVFKKALHTPKYYYIASLAFADLLVGLVGMPLAFLFQMTNDEYCLFWHRMRLICDFWHSVDVFTSAASILGLSAIGIDRYAAITKPMEYSTSFIYKRWYTLIGFTWICAALISFPPVIHLRPERNVSQNTSDRFSECNFPDNPPYILFASLVCFYLPLLVMIYVYIRVYSVAKKQEQGLRRGFKRQHLKQLSKSFLPQCLTSQNSQTPIVDREASPENITLRVHCGSYRQSSAKGKPEWRRMSHDQKAEKFVGLVMGVFVFCWLPYFLYFLLSGVFGMRLKDEYSHELLLKILSWLGYTNSALDVLVYIVTSKELQRVFLHLFLNKPNHEHV